eukprot:TRINITY_DN1783_c0_g1_i2.p1 TRINITY_DN1783_c0_g1~~TRINITY_DN1783_c0_g1_i2.p1  ORF type:complete len:576 (-),score=245.43 TRINITY_DN1783_c0_g1_i2:202-1929(-)
MADESPASSTAVVERPHPPPAKRPPPGPTPSALTYTKTTGFRRLLQSWRLARVVRARVAKNSILAFSLGGSLPETVPPGLPFRPAPTTSLESVTNALRHAAHDPRISAVFMRLTGFQCGWAKLQELRRHLDYFRASGKKVTVYMETGAEKEYYLSLSADEVFVPPTGMLVLRGFMGGGSFLRGVLEKVGIDPQVQRRGAYKSAGDQLARTDMSDAQREVVESILDATYERFISAVAEAKGKDPAEVKAFLDRAPFEMEEYADAGYFELKYEDEVLDMLKRRHNDGEEEKQLKAPLKSVNLRKYDRVTDKLLALSGKERVAIVRASGAITSGPNGNSPVMGATLGSESVVAVIRRLRLDDKIKAVVLRIDSPGGSALASDVMWREIRKCCEAKPVIASMSDVAASGGYYMAMACPTIVAEAGTITGSIGVITAKPSLKKAYERIGYNKETYSRGALAELLVDDRPFSVEEADYFSRSTDAAYKSFVTKCAESRGMTYEELHAVAQGRVWLGGQASTRGLVDHEGGLWTAVELAKQAAEIPAEAAVNLVEARFGGGGLLARLGVGAVADAGASGGGR